MELVSRDAVIKSLANEYNKRNAWREGGLKLAYIEKAVNDVPPENDVIPRQAAIDAIMAEPADLHYPSWYAGVIREV